MFKIDLMPAGGGESWDDGGRGQVAAILISYSQDSINSLRFLYFKDGELQFSEDHGKLSGSSQMIRLGYPTEFLTAVHGYRTNNNGVSSITFVTNKAKYGPFGDTEATPDNDYDIAFKFRRSSAGDSINGFHGTVNSHGHIGSIGIYLHTATSAARPDSKPLSLGS
ncbi:unnamed protein product [Cuscuta epithymum]|uniref:Jacalin-type lectin domain-containing protein n=1 Tax=Cuscuta epithymum TaxID=186058 RepID=A0AAV0EDF6_9ASTE|nr:unnamed protein product [Cuscuta epithymum]